MILSRALPVAVAALAATPGLAAPLACNFTQECFMDLDCETTSYAFEIDLAAGTGSDITGDFDVVETAEGAMATTTVLKGMFGGLRLLTIGANTSIMTVHIAAGPASVNYYGTCGDT